MPLSRDDQAAYAALRDASGLDRRAFEDAFANWYPTLRPGMGLDAIKQSFTEFAQARSWPQADIDRSTQGYETLVRQGIPQPDSQSDEQTIRDAEKLLKEDMQSYWRDASLQEKYGEALARRGERAEQERNERKPAGPSIRDGQILNGLERAMRVDPGAYWGDPEAQRLFGETIARTIGEDPGSVRPPGPSTDSGDMTS